jgi:hypothetical protein
MRYSDAGSDLPPPAAAAAAAAAATVASTLAAAGPLIRYSLCSHRLLLLTAAVQCKSTQRCALQRLPCC